MTPTIEYQDYAPQGAALEIFTRKDKELVISGPAGTGKSRGVLEKLNFVCEKYSDLRALMFRKTRKSLTQTGMVTFEKEVLPAPDWIPFHTTSQEYRYPNGSILAVAGIDDPQKILSSQWDIAYGQQAEELDEEDWENVLSRMRNYKMGYVQLIGDVNPGPPTHWMLSRRASGRLKMVESRHEDNPVFYDRKKQEFTALGKDYLSSLDNLTGARYKRLRLGIWASAEGTVYEESWDRAKHLIDRFYPNRNLTEDAVDPSWPRYWVIDFGYTNPFVWQAWAEDPDGRLIRYKEIYRTKTIVEDHCQRIKEVTKNEPKPKIIICDHDAEDRATFEKHIGIGTKAAWKSVSPGIQAVETRLRAAGDGKPRLYYMRDSVVDLDPELLRNHLPTCTEDEYEVYAWDTSAGKKIKEEPVKKFDHGQDSTRYIVTWRDETWRVKHRFGSLISVTKSGDGGEGGGGLSGGGGWSMGQTTIGERWGN